MGIQIHANNNYRRVVELIQSGAIGPIQEVVVWCGKAWGGGKLPAGTFEAPASLKWDLWLGPAPERPFAPNVYHPKEWRRWWDFGCGTLGDMACHLVDLPFWALDLRSPTTVETEGPPVDSETAPLGMTVRYEFAATSNRPAVKLTWHDGNRIPKAVADHKAGFMGIMFLGEKGQLYADYGSHKLYPEEQFKGFTPPSPSIPNSVGHWKEWTEACKSGSPTTCNFDYSAALSETVLLGNVAYRAGKKIEWDGAAGKVTNCPEAAQYLGREYRQGWTL
jgi:predicted dehydrogenase